jgi:hypothetical protein
MLALIVARAATEVVFDNHAKGAATSCDTEHGLSVAHADVLKVSGLAVHGTGHGLNDSTLLLERHLQI